MESIHRPLGEGDLVDQFGVREHEWPGGSFRGFDVPSGTFSRDVAFAYRLVNGRIAERWAVRDDLAMLLQLGALKAGRPGTPAPTENTRTTRADC
jgi:predicted ester cyclase